MSRADPLRLMSSVTPGEVIKPLGSAWVACDDALPWIDCHSYLRYAVYSPAYGNEVFICRFQLWGASWWHDDLQVGIGGVTHWRVARASEKDFKATKSKLPGAGATADPQALARLKRWWQWYVEYHGIDL